MSFKSSISFLSSFIKKYTVGLMSATMLGGTVSAMNTTLSDKFLEFRKESVFNRYTVCNFTDTKMFYFKDDEIYIHLISKSYNLFKCCVEENSYLQLQKIITRDTIENLIQYIHNYKFDNTFKSITEILHLTVECIINRYTHKIVDFSKIGFDFARFKSDPLTITFENFKKCMIARLQELL